MINISTKFHLSCEIFATFALTYHGSIHRWVEPSFWPGPSFSCKAPTSESSPVLGVEKFQNTKTEKGEIQVPPSCWLLYSGYIYIYMDMNGELYWYIGTCNLLPCGMLCCSITSVVPLGFNYVKKSSESLQLAASTNFFTALARSTIYVQWAP